ncbi:flavin reductase family protein [Egbenema bharatensis]|uniref:flavin reductase family protein n=1 Tax=Egbenema bharatensis TaxID=3463334 RepID=UPI003A884850
MVRLDSQQPIWDHFFLVAPLVVIGTRELEGGYDLAPKHMAMPIGWDNYFGFVCTPRHHTYQNICREKVFTVSFPHPDQVVLASLSATPRCDDGETKPALSALPTVPATTIDGVFLRDAYLDLECELEQIVDGFGQNSLIVGKIIAAQVQEQAQRVSDRDDQDVLGQAPLLAYLSPGYYTQIDQGAAFPFHVGFKR